MKELNYYQIFADVFRYPGEHFNRRLMALLPVVTDRFPGMAKMAGHLVETFTRMPLLQQQEYYLKTFDVQAVCYLDLGYLMFGEDYKRAQLLVNLQEEHRKSGVDCGSELGDHLPNILLLLSRTEDPEFAEELGFVITLPAVRFMVTKFKNIKNLYKDMLEILLAFLQYDFKGEGLDEYAVPEHIFQGKHDFLMPSPKQAICETMCNKRKTF